MYDWYFGGMHWIWWILWLILLFWIFLIPYPTPGQNRRKDKAMEALRYPMRNLNKRGKSFRIRRSSYRATGVSQAR